MAAVSSKNRNEAQPSFMKPKTQESPSIKPSFRPNSEALFEPKDVFNPLDETKANLV